jgi:RHS repeat-associated protein
MQSSNINGITVAYTYDNLNRLSAVVDNRLTAGQNTTSYAYDPASNLATRTYPNGLQRVSQNQAISGAWTASFYGYDGFGSIRQPTNSAGTVTDTYDYDAWGNAVNVTGSRPNNYLYRGEQFDGDLTLYYLRARYFNPLSGRFLTRDPENGHPYAPAALEKYTYAADDAVNRIDPSGRAETEEQSYVQTLFSRSTTLLATRVGAYTRCFFSAEILAFRAGIKKVDIKDTFNQATIAGLIWSCGAAFGLWP